MNAKILLISQDLDLTATMSKVLTGDGHDVSTCSKPNQVISFIREKGFDIVFIDVHMRDAPYEKIVEVITRVAAESVLVLVTSYAFPDVAKHDRPGVGVYLVQPLSEEKIRNSVSRALHQASLSLESRRLLSIVTEAKKQWEATVDALSQIIAIVDEAGRIIRINRALETWSSGSVETSKGRSPHELLHPGCESAECVVPARWDELSRLSFDAS